MRTLIPLSVLLCAATGLAGCGGEEELAKPTADRHVITSAMDCERAAPLTVEQCSKALERAVSLHEKTSPTYPSMTECETTEGAGRCERTEAKRYRPRLSAFVVVAETPPVAYPLYTAKPGEAGFRSNDSTNFLIDNEKLRFSLKARQAAVANTVVSTGRRSGPL